jgi:hypothetical protein
MLWANQRGGSLAGFRSWLLIGLQKHHWQSKRWTAALSFFGLIFVAEWCKCGGAGPKKVCGPKVWRCSIRTKVWRSDEFDPSHIASNVEAKAKQGGHATRHDNRGKPVFSSSVSAVPLRCGAIGRIALAMAAPPRQPSGSQVAPEKSDAPCLINWLAVENYVQTNGSQCPYYGGWIVGQGQSESVQEEHAISRYVTPSKTKKQTAIPPDRHLPSATCHRPSAVSVLSIAFPTTPSIHFFPIAAPMTTPIHPFVPRSP